MRDDVDDPAGGGVVDHVHVTELLERRRLLRGVEAALFQFFEEPIERPPLALVVAVDRAHRCIELVSDARDELTEGRHLLGLDELQLRFLELAGPVLEAPEIDEALIGDGDRVRELGERRHVVETRLLRVRSADEDRAVGERHVQQIPQIAREAILASLRERDLAEGGGAVLQVDDADLAPFPELEHLSGLRMIRDRELHAR